MNILIVPLFYVLMTVLDIVYYALIIYVILNWLYILNIVNPHNPTLNKIAGILHGFMHVLLRPLQNKIPRVGGIDFSPLILLLIITFLQRMLGQLVVSLSL